MDKHIVADILNEIGFYLEWKGESPFKTRAYENGARAVESLDEDLETLVQKTGWAASGALERLWNKK